MKKSCLLALALVAMWGLTHVALNVQTADAAGFHIFEWDNRANGMGGAVIASTNPNPSAIAYNPAGITKLEGLQLQVGASFIAPKADVTVKGAETATTKGKVYAVPHAFLTYQLSDKIWFGIGEFSRFGLGTNYEHDWAGAATVYKSSVETVSIQPTIAYKAADNMSLALGVEIIAGKMDLRRNVQAVGEDYHMLPEGMSWSWVASMQYEPSDMVAFGLNYRKGFVFKGRGDFIVNNNVIDDMTMWANFPGTLSAGVEIKPLDDLTFEFDVVHSFWSDFVDMEYDFSDEILNATSAFTFNRNNATSVKNYNDSTRLQFGAEYQACDDIAVRLGYVHDPSPQNYDHMDYMVPANDRSLYSTGLTWNIADALSMDFSYMHLRSKAYEIENNLSAKVDNGVTHILGFNFNYKF